MNTTNNQSTEKKTFVLKLDNKEYRLSHSFGSFDDFVETGFSSVDKETVKISCSKLDRLVEKGRVVLLESQLGAKYAHDLEGSQYQIDPDDPVRSLINEFSLQRDLLLATFCEHTPSMGNLCVLYQKNGLMTTKSALQPELDVQPPSYTDIVTNLFRQPWSETLANFKAGEKYRNV